MNRYLYNIKLAVVALALTLGVGYAYAQTVNFVSPPTGVTQGQCRLGERGCDAPIHAGPANQAKTGGIFIGAPSGFTNALKVGTTGSALKGSALEIASTTAGFLPPRMTTVQRDALTSGLSAAEKTAVNGLVVYNITTNSLERWNGSAWGAASEPASGTSGPAFSARMNSNFSAPSGQYSLVPFDLQLFDTHNNYNEAAPNYSFRPSVPGQYLITATVWAGPIPGSAWTMGLHLYKNGGVHSYSWNSFWSNNGVGLTFAEIINVTEADVSAGAWYTMRFYNGYSSSVTVYNGAYSNFSASRVGNPATVTQETINVPPGAVVFFASSVCPTPGWTQYAPASGRYIVGLNNGTSFTGAGIAPALYDGENRNTPGSHTHQANIGHSHTTNIDHNHGAGTFVGELAEHHHGVYNGLYSTSGSGIRGENSGSYNLTTTITTGTLNSAGYSYRPTGPVTGVSGWVPAGYDVKTSSAPSVGNITSVEASPVSINTNAPYVGLLACKKNS